VNDSTSHELAWRSYRRRRNVAVAALLAFVLFLSFAIADVLRGQYWWDIGLFVVLASSLRGLVLSFGSAPIAATCSSVVRGERIRLHDHAFIAACQSGARLTPRTVAPNKRLKLTGGDRSNGTGVLWPLTGQRTVVPRPCAGGRVARSLSAGR